MKSEELKLFIRQGPIRRLKGTRSPARWQKECEIDFPKGKNPWLDIFTEDVVQNIAAHIPVIETTQSETSEQGDDLYELRGQLAGVAEIFHETIRIHGSPASPSAKREKLTPVLR